MPWLGMATAMMNLTRPIVTLMLGTVACLMLLQIIAQSVLVIINRLALLKIFLHLLEMDYAMMKKIMQIAAMIMETVACLINILVIAQNVRVPTMVS